MPYSVQEDGMLPRIVRLHPGTYQRLVRLSKEAQRDGAYRVAKRLQAVLLNSQGRTSGELAEILQSSAFEGIRMAGALSRAWH